MDASESSPGQASAAHDPYAVLRDGNYVRFLLAGLCATVGGQMQGIAVGWELYERTGSPAALGFVGLAQVVPVLLLAIPMGHAADRYSRMAQIVSAHVLLCTAALGLAGLSFWQGPIGLRYLFLVLAGTGQVMNMPARWAILPQVVPRDQIGSAVTWNSSAWQIASVAGPALGGLVIARTHGATVAYVANAACSAVVVVLTLSLRLRPIRRETEPLSWASLMAGLRFVFRHELILATITLDLFAVLLGGATALLPVFARDILRVGPAGLGWLRAAPSIGAFLMAILLAHRPPMRRAGRSLLWAVGGFGVATIVFGLSSNPYLSFAMLFITGALDNVSVVVRHSLVQVLTPDAMRGRVSAVNTIFIGSSNELGEFESGLVARYFGSVAAVVGGGIGAIVVVFLVAAVWPVVVRLGPLHELEPAAAERT